MASGGVECNVGVHVCVGQKGGLGVDSVGGWVLTAVHTLLFGLLLVLACLPAVILVWKREHRS